jgi:phospholipid/cholesterol/gamma-HCH transport system ATP-binding protein
MPSEASIAPFSHSDTHPPEAPARARRDTPPAPEPPVVVRVSELTKDFSGAKVLDGVSFELRKGRVYSVIGPSGCGKTTLLKGMLGLQPMTSGGIELLGTDVATAPESRLDAVRTRTGVLFQSSALISSMTVFENVALPLRKHTRKSPSEITEVVHEKLCMVGMEDAAARKPGELSGGMRKRCALARAIALEPELLFLDEPTSGADPIMAALLDDLVLDLSRRLGATAVVVTHDMRSAFRLSHEILMLWQGRIHRKGPPADFIETDDPAINQFVQGRKQGPMQSKG